MTIDLSEEEIKFISIGLATLQETIKDYGPPTAEFKALRSKIDSAVLIGAMEEKK